MFWFKCTLGKSRICFIEVHETKTTTLKTQPINLGQEKQKPFQTPRFDFRHHDSPLSFYESNNSANRIMLAPEI